MKVIKKTLPDGTVEETIEGTGDEVIEYRDLERRRVSQDETKKKDSPGLLTDEKRVSLSDDDFKRLLEAIDLVELLKKVPPPQFIPYPYPVAPPIWVEPLFPHEPYYKFWWNSRTFSSDHVEWCSLIGANAPDLTLS